MIENNWHNYLFYKNNPTDATIVKVKNVEIGGAKVVIMAGPCVIDNESDTKATAAMVKAYGATVLRGGAFKPRTSPYSFQGMGSGGLDILEAASKALDMPTISEVTGVAHLASFSGIDLIQVGARNMQNYELLKALGRQDKPVLLKRGFSNTIEEFLMSAEYIMKEGNKNVILCERGIRTFEPMVRNSLDISAIPILKKYTHLPVVVDPSHASGIYWLVKPLAMAAIAAGADGLLVEAHINPMASSCDPEQTLTAESFGELMVDVRRICAAVDRGV